jgi:hypothetical protein
MFIFFVLQILPLHLRCWMESLINLSKWNILWAAEPKNWFRQNSEIHGSMVSGPRTASIRNMFLSFLQHCPCLETTPCKVRWPVTLVQWENISATFAKWRVVTQWGRQVIPHETPHELKMATIV